MAKSGHEILAFNRGVVSPKLMARIDVPRVALSAETQTNFIPSTLGAMSLRPGLEYVGATRSNLAAKHIPFTYSNSDTALLELTDLKLRIRTAGVLLTRAAVTTALFIPGGFDTDLVSWTDLDEAGAVSEWLTGGYMSLLGTGATAAIREQAGVLGAGASGLEHGLNVVIARGPVRLRIGTTSGAENLIAEISLATGSHYLAFTPTTNFYVRFFSYEEYPALVDFCGIAAAGVVEIPTVWPAAALPRIRYTQSGDVVYITCVGYPPQRIERVGARAWRVVAHLSDKGPFRAENLTVTTLASSALRGLVTLTASRTVFNSGHVGAIFRATSDGQAVAQNVAAANAWTDSIKVEGADAARIFGITITGVWVATVTLQRSVGVVGNWKDVINYTTNQSITLDDALRNQTVYYRIGVKTGNYTSGTVILEMVYASGSITGIARITAVASATSATAYVLKDFGGLAATDNWAEGSWSAYRGYPAALALRDGRLWLAGSDKIWASVVDDYSNHDPYYIGDAGPINRSIGEGAVATINWMTSGATQLAIGADGAEYGIKSTAFGEPITPFNFNIRPVTSLGSYNVDAEQLDSAVLFIDRSGSRLMELTSEGATDLTILAPHMVLPYVVDMAVQRRPDSRVHCVRSDGKVAVLVTSKTEDVRAWVLVETDGFVEEAFTLPGLEEDNVYYVVKRTVNAATVRYLEKFALTSECVGGLVNKQADAYLYYNGAATATITGLGHLEAKSVVVWADGIDRGTFTVTAGAITLPAPTVTQALVGLVYTAQFKSTKLAASGVVLLARKRVSHIGVLLTDTHAKGLKYGPDFTLLDDMPEVEAGEVIATTGIWAGYNYDHIEFNGSYTVDSRLCLQATAPRPCTVLATIIEMDA